MKQTVTNCGFVSVSSHKVIQAAELFLNNIEGILFPLTITQVCMAHFPLHAKDLAHCCGARSLWVNTEFLFYFHALLWHWGVLELLIVQLHTQL